MFSSATCVAIRYYIILPVLVILLFCVTVQAQIQSRLDGYTPTELQQGSPAGSYPLSGFESINNYNGNLNVALPLLHIGGRGTAGHTMTLPISAKWEVIRGSDSQGIADDTIFRAGDVWQVGYSPGVLIGTSAMDIPAGGTYCPPSTFRVFLTRLRFIMPDGTEVQLHDKKYQGAGVSVNVSCAPTTPNRGKVFVSDDGESMTFISDTDILDQPNYVQGTQDLSTAGVLLMKDGTRYRIDSSKVSWIRDRNGNKVFYTYEAGASPARKLLTATDSLNRQISITYATTVPGYDEITFKGFGGASRSIKIWYNSLTNVLRSGSTLQFQNQLFPEIYSYSLYSGNWNSVGTLVSKVELPDQRTYQFYYNSYGEVTRIILPTGGGFDYEYVGAASGVQDVSHLPTIIRRCVSRKVFNTLTAATSPTSPPAGTLEQIENYVAETGLYNASSPTIVRVEHRDGANVLLTQEKHYYYGAPLEYLNTGGEPILYSVWSSGKEYKTEVFDVSSGVAGSVLRKNETIWSPSVSGPYPSSNLLPAPNPKIAETTNTLGDTNQVSRQTFSYDQYNNQTDVYEYDLGSGSYGALLRRSHTDFLTSGYDTIVGGITAPNAAATVHLRSLPAQSIVYDASNTQKALTTFEYDNYTPDANNYHAALVNRANISGLDTAFISGYTTRGNLTKVSSWRNTDGAYIDAYSQYDIAGNTVKAIDANGNFSTYEYDDRFGSPNGSAQSNVPTGEASFVTAPSVWLNGQSTFSFPSKVTNAKGHIAYLQFDYFLGKPVDMEDPNNIKSSLYYNDALDRQTQRRNNVTSATVYYSQSTITYDDLNHNIASSSDKTTAGDNMLTSKTYYDGLGRTYRTANKENASTWSYNDKNYDALGRAYKVSNPYRTSPTEWTTSTFDALGRVTQVTSPDNSIVQSQYSGNIVTVIDQAKKVRRSITDGLGRLLRVDEPTRDFTAIETTQNPLNPDLVLGAIGTPNQPTSYTYDTLDNLLAVTQTGLNASNTSVTQTRSFVYDSLKRLTSATNPESGTTTYTYYNNGNLNRKTDAAGNWMQYLYDVLNRNYENYSNLAGTPHSIMVYDGAVNGKGRLWYKTTDSYYYNGPAGVNQDHTAYDSYDALGRPLVQRQHFWSNNSWGSAYQASRTYDLAGDVLSQTNPSGKVLNYTYDQAARLTSFSGNLGETNSRTYSDGITYNAASLMTQEHFGVNNTTSNPTGLYLNKHYNKRLQNYDIRVGNSGSDEWSWNRGALRMFYNSDLTDYNAVPSGANNNGNLYRMDHFIPGNDNITTWQMNAAYYAYDSLNRLQAVQENKVDSTGLDTPAYRQQNTFDRWGNRTIDQNNTWSMDGSVWSEDAVPTGAIAAGDTDGWNWVTANPTAFSGTSAHQSATVAGLHQHYFYNATTTLTPAAGESLYAWVYLDPTSPPTEVMLQWNNGNWEHRAYWGVNTITYWGVDGTDSRRYMGALPATGGWVRLEVPAASVGLTGQAINGMAFTLIGGKATWDRAGKTAVTGGGINKDKYTVDAAYNRFTELVYDAVGNVTRDKVIGTGRMEYKHDANNRVVAAGNNFVTNNTAPTSTYRYNADGMRTRKVVSGVERWFVYGLGGELVAEYNANGAPGSPQKEYGYQGGQLLIVYDATEAADKQLQWMVADHLGTPRMVIDKTGSLGGIKRHDYLPFGEELGANVGIRSAGNGYTADQIKQKFTGYERDTETGLDFAQARYNANVQGRFTSPDPMLSSGQIGSPQTWNRYTYASNNPLKYVDPLGLYTWGASLGDNRSDADIRHEIDNLDPDKDYGRIAELQGWLSGRQAFRNALNELEILAFIMPVDQQFEVYRAINAYGKEGEANGVSILLADSFRPGVGASATPSALNTGPNGTVISGQYEVRIGRNVSASELVAQLAHEGSHVADEMEALAVWIKTGSRAQAVASPLNVTHRQLENRGYRVTAMIAEAQGREVLTMGAGFTIWRKGMVDVDQQALDALLKFHYTDQGKNLDLKRIQ